MDNIEAKGDLTFLYWYSTIGFIFLLFLATYFKKHGEQKNRPHVFQIGE
ncbi:hypothetical protein NVV31_17125 [Cytobacillus firmus]|nr:hypothetical protein [Cytobacillus firmus]MCU1807111.1 hypothetical protein [Cytobacillus firmus]